jgi:hypothetical protein
VSRDGSAAVCARIADGAVKRSGEAGWLHRLRETSERYAVRRRQLTTIQIGGTKYIPVEADLWFRDPLTAGDEGAPTLARS